MKITELKELYGEMEQCLKCPVDPKRFKDCIIMKCGHMFSNESLIRLEQKTSK